MKLRTLSHLDDAIYRETAWRRRELTTILFNVRSSRISKQQVSIRAGVALLYAHWEGWVKAISELYLEFVRQQKLPFEALSASFLGAALKSQLEEVGHARSAEIHTTFARFLVADGLTGSASFSSGLIRTESNLSSKVLKDITFRLGLSYEPFELLEVLIDEQLLAGRNSIAHGEYLEITDTLYIDLHAKTLQLLNEFTKQVQNSAATGAYKRQASSPAITS